MTVNNYFSQGKGVGTPAEQALVESTIIEMIQLAGQDYYYITRNLIAVDPVLNEAPASTFNKAFVIEMYCNNYASFGGQGHQLDPLGLDMGDSLDLVVSKKRAFEETNIDALKQGDLIYWPLTKSFWQINVVDAEANPFMALSNIYTFTLKCSRFIYNHEVFSTGVVEIDAINSIQSGFGKNDAIADDAEPTIDWTEINQLGSIQGPDSNG